jgi:NADPH-dependent 2,4-dienoyl-CoA reductase/sulfur reductase-like enzyme
MKNYQYIMIGGGMTACAAIHGLREIDKKGSVGMFSLESDPPYNRPPLTKTLWKGRPLDSIWRHAAGPGLDFHLDCRIQSLDPRNKRVLDEQGKEYSYEKLLLATGGTPRRLPFGGDQIIYFRTVGDYRHLRELTKSGKRFGVIGGGFIGSEIAAALAINNMDVTMIFPDEGIGGHNFPHDLSQFVSDYYRQKGVKLMPKERVVGLEEGEDHLALLTQSGGEIPVHGVVAGIGIQPDIDLAKGAGLNVNNGIVVDEYLQASHPDIYSAGDVAEFYNPALDKRIRVEHEDNANVMGRMAGRNMAGANETYDYLPYFYSDLFDLGYEAVGELDSRLETVSDWEDPYRKGVVYYLRDGRVRGVLLWNVWNKVNDARELIASPGGFRLEELSERIRA